MTDILPTNKTNGYSQPVVLAQIKKEEGTMLEGVRQKVFADRYSFKDSAGKALEQYPEQMFARVARAISRTEVPEKRAFWEKKFYDLMDGFKFVPGGRILSGAGTGAEVTYFNCFVIPSPHDSRGGIMESLKQLVEIQSRSGGVGLNLSSLRPKGARVRKVNGTSSGPVNWAELFSVATHDVVQQGGSRRGATMLMLWDWHPDVEEFITVKQDLSRINGANLSVCVSDGFMEAVARDLEWELVYPDLDDPDYDSVWDGDLPKWRSAGRKVKVYKTLKARALWDLICEAAWRSAEPGLHFLERSNRRSNTWYFEQLVATNPCGEQPLGAWAVCNLGAMNLSAYVQGEKFDYDSFGADVRTAVRFLDNVIDETHYFFPENEKCAKDIRRTGLGIMGLADALIKMKLSYGAEDSLPVIRRIFEVLRDNAYEASSDIASEKGSFPKFEVDKYLQGYHITALPEEIREKIKTQGIRNAVLLTIAPTGTTSLLAGVSSGVEPVYEFELIRRDRMGEHLMLHPLLEEWKKENPDLPRPSYFVSANDLTPEGHAVVQGIAQEYIDSSISKTVNAPNDHTVEDVKRLYSMAYDIGLKGITYMRDGSRPGVLSREEKKEEKKEVVEIGVEPGQTLRARADKMHGVTYKMATPVGSAFITINDDENGYPLELFVSIGKAGSDLTAMAEALGRLVSTLLRLNSSITSRARAEEVASQLTGIGGRRSIGFGSNRVYSLPDAVAQALKRHLRESAPIYKEEGLEVNGGVVGKPDSTQAETASAALNPDLSSVSAESLKEFLNVRPPGGDICPECGVASLVYEEGCAKCYVCGHSEC